MKKSKMFSDKTRKKIILELIKNQKEYYEGLSDKKLDKEYTDIFGEVLDYIGRVVEKDENW